MDIFYCFQNKKPSWLDSTLNFTQNQKYFCCLSAQQTSTAKLLPFFRKLKKKVRALRINLIPVFILFKNPALWLFCRYSPLTLCKKSEKSLEPLLRKLGCQPTNQSTNNANLETFSRISLNQELFSKIRLCHFFTFIVP